MFEPFTFTPSHQPDPDKPVQFDLKPIDQRMGFRLVQCFGGAGLEFEDLVAVLKSNVVGWSGLSVPYSEQAKREFLAGEFDYDRQFWIAECARELYKRRAPGAAERKNS